MNDAIAWHSEIAPRFDAGYGRSAAFKERLSVWTGLIERFAGPECDVLDAGCGSGVLAQVASRRARSVLGFDASPQMIALAETRRQREALGNTTFRVARLGDPGLLAARRFDLVLCSSVLEYVDDFWASFEWLASSLEPDGVLVFSMPNGASVYRMAERIIFKLVRRPAYYAHVRTVPSLGQVRAELAARGLEIVAVQYYAATPGLSAIARSVGRPNLADNLLAVACRRSQR